MQAYENERSKTKGFYRELPKCVPTFLIGIPKLGRQEPAMGDSLIRLEVQRNKNLFTGELMLKKALEM